METIKRFLVIFLPLAIFFGSLTVMLYYKDVKTDLVNLKKREFYTIDSQVKMVRHKFETIYTDLQFLALQSELTDYLKANNASQLDSLAEELLLFAQIKKIYGQIQFIDESGSEVVVIRTSDGNPKIAVKGSLQNKAWQEYFQETIASPKGSVYISPYDLSSKGSAEFPMLPVLRFSMPVVDDADNKRGIIVLSHPVAHILDELQAASSSSRIQTILINPQGYYLNGTIQGLPAEPGKEKSKRIETFLAEEWQKVNEGESGQFLTQKGLVTFSTIYPDQQDHSPENSSDATATIIDHPYLWKAVSFIPEKILNEWPDKILGRILMLYSVCLFIIAICSFLLARTALRRRKAEMAMRENEEELRAINEAAANAIIVIDNNKNVLHWNPAAERLFHYTAQEVVEKSITSIISPPKHQSAFTKMSKQFNIPIDSDSMEAKTIELFGYKKDGTEFPVEVSFSAFKKREQWHTVGIIRDISARKEMERNVLQANKFESLGVLSSGIAHDFNNLLTAIIGNINLVSKLSGTPPDSLELLKNAEKASRRAKALTQQLLTFSKEGTPIRKTTSIETLIRDSVEYALHGSIIVSSFDIPEDLYLVDIDAAQIGQVLQNIVTNGRQSIRGSGAIIISCRNVKSQEIAELPANLSGKYIEIAIRDTGQGISEKNQSRVFDPYFTTKEHGSGLGLTIAHSIIQRHDGHIIFTSDEHKGTIFTVYLPAAVDQHPPKEQEKSKSKGKRFRIMVVDNEEMLLNIAGRMLVHLGHECVCARSAREALDVYKHMWKTGSPVDGVIVDLTLPGGMGGKETAAAIFDVNSEARIIVSSGYSNDPVMVDFDEYGFCAAIAKPFDMDELAEVINDVLE